MRTLTRFTLAAISLLVCARAGAAQAGAEGWVEFAPPGEGFAVLMPKQPASEPSQARAGGLSVAGRRYVAAGDDGSSYIVWSFKDTSGHGAQEYANAQPRSAISPYLDGVAEVA